MVATNAKKMIIGIAGKVRNPFHSIHKKWTKGRGFLKDNNTDIERKKLESLKKSKRETGLIYYPMDFNVGSLVWAHKDDGTQVLEQRVGDRYRLDSLLRYMENGAIYEGTVIERDEGDGILVQELEGDGIAIKLETINVTQPHLPTEIEIYKLLGRGLGIPVIHCIGNENLYNIIVMELLGPDLQYLFDGCSGRFSMKTILLIADQLINRFELIHSKGVIHGALSLDQIVIGIGAKANLLYITNFSMSSLYTDTRANQHVSYQKKKLQTNEILPKFASINAHDGISPTRRDDMESLGYLLVYLFRGSVPWLKNSKTKQQTREIKSSVKKLCDGLPSAFEIYLSTCQSLRYKDKPNYAFLRQLFWEVFSKNGYDDFYFDWANDTQGFDLLGGISPVKTYYLS